MNAIEFVNALEELFVVRDNKNMSAKDFFETDAGKVMINIISKEVQVIDKKTFVSTTNRIEKIIMNNPLYKGREFFKDMRELGFSYTCIGRHRDDKKVVSTYLFRVEEM